MHQSPVTSPVSLAPWRSPGQARTAPEPSRLEQMRMLQLEAQQLQWAIHQPHRGSHVPAPLIKLNVHNLTSYQ